MRKKKKKEKKNKNVILRFVMQLERYKMKERILAFKTELLVSPLVVFSCRQNSFDLWWCWFTCLFVCLFGWLYVFNTALMVYFVSTFLYLSLKRCSQEILGLWITFLKPMNGWFSTFDLSVKEISKGDH